MLDFVVPLTDAPPLDSLSLTSRERVAYAHANLRLRTRYDMEITIEEWYRLGQMFRRGQVHGARKNHVGDIEGWVLVGDVPVCCYYSEQHQCVKTFYAPPPPLPTTAIGVKAKKLAPPKPPPTPEQEVKKDKKEFNLRVQHAVQENAVYRRDLSWFKRMLITFCHSEATRLELLTVARYLSGVSEKDHPSSNAEEFTSRVRNKVRRAEHGEVHQFRDGGGI